MTDRPVNGRVRDDSTESDSDPSGGEVRPRYGPCVRFYALFHRYLGDRAAFFGGLGIVGTLVVVRQFYAFASAPTEWSGLPSWTVVGGVTLFGFGVGYYVVRDATSCSECGEPFSRTRIAKRPVSKESDGDRPDRPYLAETYECGNCGEETTELYPQSGGRYTWY